MASQGKTSHRPLIFDIRNSIYEAEIRLLVTNVHVLEKRFVVFLFVFVCLNDWGRGGVQYHLNIYDHVNTPHIENNLELDFTSAEMALLIWKIQVQKHHTPVTF